jgi:hypothetical protein
LEDALTPFTFLHEKGAQELGPVLGFFPMQQEMVGEMNSRNSFLAILAGN